MKSLIVSSYYISWVSHVHILSIPPVCSILRALVLRVRFRSCFNFEPPLLFERADYVPLCGSFYCKFPLTRITVRILCIISPLYTFSGWHFPIPEHFPEPSVCILMLSCSLSSSIQMNIKWNHLSSIPFGRNGSITFCIISL
jgi:hypothetical protein